jgi:hypothetical protein
MGKISARFDDTERVFEGRSDFRDGEDARLHEAFDGLAMAVVLRRIVDSGTASDETRELASEALERLADGDPNAGPVARAAARQALVDNGGDESEYEIPLTDVTIDIVTRPHNQWVRTFAAKGDTG